MTTYHSINPVNSKFNSQLILLGVTVVIMIGAFVFKTLRSHHELPVDSLSGGQDDEPILSSGDMLAEAGLQSIYKGSIAGFAVNMMTNASGRVMAYVELGHDSGMHLVAIGDKSGLGSRLEEFPARFLTPVELEGDFPDFFKLFCSPDKQVEVREVFEPTTMQQFVNFCRDNDFEIFHETLYISRAKNSEGSILTQYLENFLNYHKNLLTSI